MNKNTKKGSGKPPTNPNKLRPRHIKALTLIMEGMPLYEGHLE